MRLTYFQFSSINTGVLIKLYDHKYALQGKDRVKVNQEARELLVRPSFTILHNCVLSLEIKKTDKEAVPN